MVSAKNKLISFFLSLGLAIFSWIILFVYIILKLAPFSQFGLFNIDAVGFFFSTVLLTGYTFIILFKIKSISYFPILLIILHITTLNGSSLALFFVLIELIILFLMNTASKQIEDSKTWQYTYTNEKTQSQPSQRVGQDDVFDAEYSTKED